MRFALSSVSELADNDSATITQGTIRESVREPETSSFWGYRITWDPIDHGCGMREQLHRPLRYILQWLQDPV